MLREKQLCSNHGLNEYIDGKCMLMQLLAHLEVGQQTRIKSPQFVNLSQNECGR
jgi:hypothetical protein